MRKLSLFSGVGGIDLAAHWAGMETVAFCEREPFPQKVLQKNFPGVPIYDDVCTLTADRLKEDGIIGNGRTIDIISAGYPCQPFSHAGKRRGKEDDRHLWPEVARILQEVRPTWFLGENVAGHITLGLDEVLTDLEGLGYITQAFVIPASAVYAGHRRDRVFIVGYTEHDGSYGTEIGRSSNQASDNIAQRQITTGESEGASRPKDGRIMGDTTIPGFQERRQSRQSEGTKETGTGVVAELERSGETLAYSKGNTEGRLSIGERTENTGFTCSGEDVAYATSIGQQGQGKPFRPVNSETDCEREAAESLDGCDGRYVAYSCCRRHELQEEQICTGRDSVEYKSGGATQSRMGGNVDELSAGLDGSGIDSLDDLIDFIHSYPQPALMGIPQYDWEPPRVATGVQDRTGRLKALGNAVDPLQIYPIMAAIKAIHDQITG
ncbi:DNA (cytosine-5)-methyltransferase 1 [Paenibacillus sp. 4624]|uniref:DNA cytosine methyltransferase n=1 Tax=Paenibacillus sp. 4624 TaxID=3156453 RepID=UPI003D237703